MAALGSGLELEGSLAFSVFPLLFLFFFLLTGFGMIEAVSVFLKDEIAVEIHRFPFSSRRLSSFSRKTFSVSPSTAEIGPVSRSGWLLTAVLEVGSLLRLIVSSMMMAST